METPRSLIERIICRQLWQLEDINRLRRSRVTPYLKRVNKLSNQGRRVIKFLLWCYTLHTRGRPNVMLLVNPQHRETLMIGLQEHFGEERINKLKEVAEGLGVRMKGKRKGRAWKEWDFKRYEGKPQSHNKHYERKMVECQIEVMELIEKLNSIS